MKERQFIDIYGRAQHFKESLQKKKLISKKYKQEDGQSGKSFIAEFNSSTNKEMMRNITYFSWSRLYINIT